MRARELLRVALSAIRAHKLRSVLTAFGIVMSVWTIVSVLSVILGLNEFVMSRILTLSPDVFVVDRLGIVRSREEFFELLKRKSITAEDVAELDRLCESCGEIAQHLQGEKSIRAGNRIISEVVLLGTTANYATVNKVDLEEGRFLSEIEDRGRAAVAVIGSQVREELFPQVDPLGRTITIGGLPHTVIGLIRKQGTMLGDNPDLLVYVPIRTAQKYLGRGRWMEAQRSVFVQAAAGVKGVARCQEEVLQIFRWIRSTPLGSSDPVSVITAEVLQDLWRSISVSTFLFVLAVSSVSLVVGSIVVANIMLVSVAQRTREIGVRLALGARKRDVRRQFLVEAIILAMLGGAVGTGLGAITAWLVETRTPLPATIQWWSVVLAVGSAALAGLLAGFFPARKASNLPPVEALRHE